MNFNHIYKRILIFSIFFVSFFIFTGTVKYVQTSSFNNNGTGIISLTYTAETSEVTGNNNVIGNLPFTEDKIVEYFNSDITKVTKSTVYKDKSNPELTGVSVDIFVTNLNKLNEAKAFKGVDAHWIKSDSGMVFRWLFTPEHAKTNMISLYQIKVIFEGDIRSTNGVKDGKEAKWYVLTEKMDPRGSFYEATVNSDGTTQNTFKANSKESSEKKSITENKSENKTETKTENKTENKSDDNVVEKENGKCSIFGLELPLVLLGGLAISKGLKKRRK